MLGRTFSEEEESSEENESSARQESEYTFEGFNVEFSEKIMLTPVGATQSAQAKR
jgi:hypothetical protein